MMFPKEAQYVFFALVILGMIGFSLGIPGCEDFNMLETFWR